MRGRVIAATESCEQVAFLVGMGLAAVLISHVQPQHAYAVAGVGLLAATIFAARAASANERVGVAA